MKTNMTDTNERAELYQTLHTVLGDLYAIDKEYLVNTGKLFLFSLSELFLLKYPSIYQIHTRGGRLIRIDFWEPYGWSALLDKNELMSVWLAAMNPIESISILADPTLIQTNEQVLSFVNWHTDRCFLHAIDKYYGYTQPEVLYKLGVLDICKYILSLYQYIDPAIKLFTDPYIKLLTQTTARLDLLSSKHFTPSN